MKELTEATFQTLCDAVVTHDHAGIVKLLSGGTVIRAIHDKKLFELSDFNTFKVWLPYVYSDADVPFFIEDKWKMGAQHVREILEIAAGRIHLNFPNMVLRRVAKTNPDLCWKMETTGISQRAKAFYDYERYDLFADTLSKWDLRYNPGPNDGLFDDLFDRDPKWRKVVWKYLGWDTGIQFEFKWRFDVSLSEGGIDAGRKFDQDAGTTFCETICDQS